MILVEKTICAKCIKVKVCKYASEYMNLISDIQLTEVMPNREMHSISFNCKEYGSNVAYPTARKHNEDAF